MIECLETSSNTCTTIFTSKQSVYFLQTKNVGEWIIYMNLKYNYYE